jgi:hypothetical protein
MRRLLRVAIVLLSGCHHQPSGESTTTSAQPSIENRFAKDEQSSSFVNQALYSCMDGLAQAEQTTVPGKAVGVHTKGWYCVCMGDALAVTKSPTVTADQAGARCVEFAKHVTRKTPATTRTPYSGSSFLNAGQMADALKGCRTKLELGEKTKSLAELQKETFCSCVVDSMRFRRTTSTSVPVEETRICANAAGWSW